jgi:hypothetical protein
MQASPVLAQQRPVWAPAWVLVWASLAVWPEWWLPQGVAPPSQAVAGRLPQWQKAPPKMATRAA